MRRSPLLAAVLLTAASLAVLPAASTTGASAAPSPDREVRFSTFNASLNRSAAGQLVSDLSTPGTSRRRTSPRPSSGCGRTCC